MQEDCCLKKRLRKGDLGSIEQDEFLDVIITILFSVGGKEQRQKVITDIYNLYSEQFTAPDYELLKSQNPPKERWIHNVDWAKRKLVQQDLVLPPSKSPYGVWVLSEKAQSRLSGRMC